MNHNNLSHLNEKQMKVINMLRMKCNQVKLEKSINPFDINNIQGVLSLRWQHKSTKAVFNRMADFFVNPVNVRLSAGMEAVHSICKYNLDATLTFLRDCVSPNIEGSLIMTELQEINGEFVISTEGSMINELVAVMFMLYLSHARNEPMEKRLRSLILMHLNIIHNSHLQLQAA